MKNFEGLERPGKSRVILKTNLMNRVSELSGLDRYKTEELGLLSIYGDSKQLFYCGASVSIKHPAR